MDRFQEMKAFLAVVDSGSFVRAAEAIYSSKAAVSRQVADLERRLSVRLLNRNTRTMSLTDDGRLFYQRCSELMNALEEAESELSNRSGEAVGHLRIAAPVTFANNHLAPLWGKFLAKHGRVSMEISLSDRTVDMVEEGFDLAVRITRAPHPAFVARKLASTKMVVCASPRYLELHGAPVTPMDLAQHQVLSYTYWSSGDDWEFSGADGTLTTVRVRPRLHANSGDTCVAVALQDDGIIMQPDFLVYDKIRAGRLIRILHEYRTVELGIYAMYASRRQMPLKLRYLTDFLADAFAVPPWTEY